MKVVEAEKVGGMARIVLGSLDTRTRLTLCSSDDNYRALYSVKG